MSDKSPSKVSSCKGSPVADPWSGSETMGLLGEKVPTPKASSCEISDPQTREELVDCASDGASKKEENCVSNVRPHLNPIEAEEGEVVQRIYASDGDDERSVGSPQPTKKTCCGNPRFRHVTSPRPCVHDEEEQILQNRSDGGDSPPRKRCKSDIDDRDQIDPVVLHKDFPGLRYIVQPYEEYCRARDTRHAALKNDRELKLPALPIPMCLKANETLDKHVKMCREWIALRPKQPTQEQDVRGYWIQFAKLRANGSNVSKVKQEGSVHYKHEPNQERQSLRTTGAPKRHRQGDNQAMPRDTQRDRSSSVYREDERQRRRSHRDYRSAVVEEAELIRLEDRLRDQIRSLESRHTEETDSLRREVDRLRIRVDVLESKLQRYMGERDARPEDFDIYLSRKRSRRVNLAYRVHRLRALNHERTVSASPRKRLGEAEDSKGYRDGTSSGSPSP